MHPQRPVVPFSRFGLRSRLGLRRRIVLFSRFVLVSRFGLRSQKSTEKLLVAERRPTKQPLHLRGREEPARRSRLRLIRSHIANLLLSVRQRLRGHIRHDLLGRRI